MGLSLKVWTVMIKHNMNGFRVPLTLSFLFESLLTWENAGKFHYTIQCSYQVGVIMLKNLIVCFFILADKVTLLYY